jgi:hypothetical protein
MKFIKDLFKVKQGLMFFKLVLSYMLIISPFFIYYFSSLELYAYNGLFKISYSFFENSTLEMKIWDSFIIFIYLLTHSGIKTILFILLTVGLTFMPFVITQSILQDTEIRRGNLKVVGFFVITISYFILLIALMQFLQISDLFIRDIEKKYLLEHERYCQILNKQNKSGAELVISENVSVPYKLILAESSIIYFKPNEPIATWKTFDTGELSSMKSKCLD